MILHIKNETTLRDAQSSFSKTFPYLKIEFAPAIKEETSLTEFNPDVQLKKIQKKKLFPNMLQVQSWYKFNDVENLFNNMFGLSVKLFRKNEATWIEASEDLPVEELNKRGKQSAEYYIYMNREKGVHIW
jgi:hypothetical protein